MGMTPLMLGVDIGTAAQGGRQAQAAGYAQAAQTRQNAALANAGMFTNLLGQAMTIPNWSNISNPFSSGGGGWTNPAGYSTPYSYRASAPYSSMLGG